MLQVSLACWSCVWPTGHKLTPAASVQLSSLGIPEQCMVFTHVTMQSEKYVCVRETGTTNNVVIVDMANPSAPLRRPITADSTILAPSSKTLALKAAAQQDGNDNLQVFNLDTKQKLKSYLNPSKVQFWTWLDDKTIGLVTESAVFHWSMEVRSRCGRSSSSQPCKSAAPAHTQAR